MNKTCRTFAVLTAVMLVTSCPREPVDPPVPWIELLEGEPRFERRMYFDHALAACIDPTHNESSAQVFPEGTTFKSAGVEIEVSRFPGMNNPGEVRIGDWGESGGAVPEFFLSRATMRVKFDEPQRVVRTRIAERGNRRLVKVNGIELEAPSTSTSVTGPSLLDNQWFYPAAPVAVFGERGPNDPAGWITAVGSITEFEVGGDEFFVDDFCFQVDDCLPKESYLLDMLEPTTANPPSIFEGTYGLAVEVLGPYDRIVTTVSFSALDTSLVSGGEVTARVFDDSDGSLVDEATASLPIGYTNAGATIAMNDPVLKSGGVYRIAAYISVPAGEELRAAFHSSVPNQPNSIETQLLFRIIHPVKAPADGVPEVLATDADHYLPITIHTHCEH